MVCSLEPAASQQAVVVSSVEGRERVGCERGKSPLVFACLVWAALGSRHRRILLLRCPESFI